MKSILTDFNLHMAKVYLCQAQATKWSNWKCWLLNCAAKNRREHLETIRKKNNPNHFRGATKMVVEKIDDNGQWRLF